MATIEKLICNLKDEVSKWFYQKGEVDGKLDEKAGTSVASSSGNGLMSSADKVKLDGVATGANKTVVDSAMSTTSTNPVQNKTVKAELDSLNSAKANANHVHNRLNPTNIPKNADLNDYTTQGSFYVGENATAQTLANCPIEEAFHLEVYRHAGVRQVLQAHSTYNVKTFERNYYANNWSDWYQVYNQSNIDSAMSTTSTNPVQNKVVKAQLDSLNSIKANTGHTHNDYSATVTVPCEYGTVKKFKKNGWAFVVWENIDISSIPNDTWTTLADIGWSNQAGNRYTGNFQTADTNSNRFRINENGQLGAWRVKESYNMSYYGYIVYPTAD